MFAKVGIFGVGLMGGSLGLAIKQLGLAREVIGIGRSLDRLEEAQRRGQVDRVSVDFAAVAAELDLAVVGLPVAHVAPLVKDLSTHLSPRCLLTDLASTKRAIVQQITAECPHSTRFVGSHPLAGDHRTGCEHARADLYRDRVVVVTPTPQSQSEAVEQVCEFWRAIGSRVVTMDAAQHDELVAASSHVPHLVAAALAAATPREALQLVAGGWLDATRIAAGDVELWRQIFASNRAAVLAGTDRFMAQLQTLREALASGDDAVLTQLLTQGKQTRDAVGDQR